MTQMKLYEYLAKGVMAKFGIPVPRGRAASTPDEAAEIAREVGAPVAVKAQVLAGGRGKAGGIGFASDPDEAREVAGRILEMEVRGLKVEKVLVEEKLRIDGELYLGLIVEGSRRAPILIASAKGGMEIEEVPEKDIFRKQLDVRWGLMPFVARQVVRKLGLEGGHASQVADIAVKLYRVFKECDAELTEINPLVISGEKVIAADARLNVDEDALYRHPELPKTHEGTEIERRVKEMGLAYVQLDGDIAVMANGAGMAMATLDVLQRYGGRPANFLDAGGGAAAEPMAKAIEILLSTRPSVIFVNIFGGITRCDEVAKALVQVKTSRGIDVPVVTRLVGTNEEEGINLLKQHGFEAFSSMEQAAMKAVALAKSGR